MFQLRLTPRNLSDLIWSQWAEQMEPEMDVARGTLREMFDACEATRGGMSYNTGSITFSAAVALYVMVRQARPSTIFEVGTFIGKSTLAMGLALDKNGPGGNIYTCDGSNDFHLPKITQCGIHGFSKTMSTEALRQVAQKGVRIDMMHLDGRISAEDAALIESIADPNLALAIDDFEGTEKGVANISVLRARPFFKQHVLVYPMTDAMALRLGCVSRNTTALLVPASGLTFANQ